MMDISYIINQLGEDRENYFTDVVELPDKGFMLTGTAFSATDQDVWLVRLDSMGCLEPGCGDTVTAVINIPNQNGLFSIYPNPVSNTSTVEIKIPDDFQIISGEKLSLNIYDISGKIVDTYGNISVNNPNETARVMGSQAWGSARTLQLRRDRGQRRHVDEAAHRAGRGQDVRRRAGTE